MAEQAKNQYAPDYAVAPSEVLQDHLEFQGMTQEELSTRLGLSKKTINEIIKGKAPIQPGTALKLEKAVGRSACFWNNLERIYREKITQIDERD